MTAEASPTRLPRAHRRTQIARAALALIGREGVTALGAARLAAEVGLTSGALFRHFASMEEILEAAVKDAVERIQATFPPPHLPPLVRLRALAEARITLLTREPGLAWLLRSEQAPLCLPAASLAPLEALVVASRRTLRAALVEAQAAGLLRRDLEPDVLLLVFVSTVHALIGQPGLQGVHGRGGPPAGRALDGLFTLLAPPGAPPGEPPR